MTLVDRFICRREGHIPSFTFDPNSYPCTVICPCVRCGRMIEITHPAPAEDGDVNPRRRGKSKPS